MANSRDNPEIRRYLARVPSGGVIVEVGVARGNFSGLLLRHCRPRKLILVDSWRPYGEPSEPMSRLTAADHERSYQHVCRRFAEQTACGLAEIWRCTSVEAATRMRAESRAVDFVYIDADHQEAAVYEDLEIWSPLISDGGLLGGHDYVSLPSWPDLGVVRAVERFCEDQPWRIIHLTRERWPSFLLARRP